MAGDTSHSHPTPTVDEIRARRAAIGAVSWTLDDSFPLKVYCGESLVADCDTRALQLSPEELEANADFIAHAPTDIDTLLAENDALRARVKELEATPRQMMGVRMFCVNHFSFRRDDGDPPICEKAFAEGRYPCEFRAEQL